MRQTQTVLKIRTPGQGLIDITRPVAAFAAQSGIESGLLTLFIQHTSASLTIQENADPDVLADLNDFFRRIVREDASLYRHSMEGPDDMPAHIRSALTQVSLSIPLLGGALALGTWQGLYVFEHRAHGHERRVIAHVMGN